MYTWLDCSLCAHVRDIGGGFKRRGLHGPQGRQMGLSAQGWCWPAGTMANAKKPRAHLAELVLEASILAAHKASAGVDMGVPVQGLVLGRQQPGTSFLAWESQDKLGSSIVTGLVLRSSDQPLYVHCMEPGKKYPSQKNRWLFAVTPKVSCLH